MVLGSRSCMNLIDEMHRKRSQDLDICMPVRQVPEEGKIYAFNEGNYEGWETGLREYMDSLKNASKWGGKPYSARRVPALHQCLCVAWYQREFFRRASPNPACGLLQTALMKSGA